MSIELQKDIIVLTQLKRDIQEDRRRLYSHRELVKNSLGLDPQTRNRLMKDVSLIYDKLTKFETNLENVIKDGKL